MIGKAGLAAVALISAVAAGRTVDLRHLYDEMYPVNTLKRDALNLCQRADLTFVRAIEDDRESCYDHMPYSFALAIGRIQPGNPLAGLFAVGAGTPGAAFLPEAGLYSWAIPPRPPIPRRGYFARAAAPCRDRPEPPTADRVHTAQAIDVLAGRPGQPPEKTLAEMGLLPREPRTARDRPSVARVAIPVARGAPPNPTEAAGLSADQPSTLLPLSAASAGDLGDEPGPAAGCREHT